MGIVEDRELAELIDSIPAKRCRWWNHRYNQWSEPVSAAKFGGYSSVIVQSCRCIDCNRIKTRKVVSRG